MAKTLTTREDAISAVKTLKSYCETYYREKLHLERSIRRHRLPLNLDEKRAAERQLLNHYKQKYAIHQIDKLTKEIEEIIESRVTYRSSNSKYT